MPQDMSEEEIAAFRGVKKTEEDVYIVDQLKKQIVSCPITPTIVIWGGGGNCFGLAMGRCVAHYGVNKK